MGRIYNVVMEFDDIDLIEKQLEAHTLYEGKILKLRVDDVLLPDGSQAKREYVSHRGGAAILAIDKQNCVYLVRQYRYAYRQVVEEIPAGKLEEGEDAIVTAARELEEEIGRVAEHIEPLGLIYPTPGYTNEHLYIFLATGLKNTKPHLDEGEFLNVIKLPFEQALKRVVSGEIRDAKTCFALLKYALTNSAELKI